jgi:hypothetical protein
MRRATVCSGRSIRRPEAPDRVGSARSRTCSSSTPCMRFVMGMDTPKDLKSHLREHRAARTSTSEVELSQRWGTKAPVLPGRSPSSASRGKRPRPDAGTVWVGGRLSGWSAFRGGVVPTGFEPLSPLESVSPREPWDSPAAPGWLVLVLVLVPCHCSILQLTASSGAACSFSDGLTVDSNGSSATSRYRRP